MSFTPEEAVQAKIDIGILKNSTSQVLKAIGDNTEQLSLLVSKFEKDDVRREYEVKERLEDKETINQLSTKVDIVNARLDSYIDDQKPTLLRLKQKHEAIDNFKNSMGSTWGKMTAAALISAAVLFVGYVFSIEVKL
jgi:hypothetical protein